MAYQHFYQFYDSLMEDVPYEKYIHLVKEYAKKDQIILDVGCGTGSVLTRLIEEGFLVDGLDLSDEMLLVTQQKLSDKKLHTNLYQDDMRNIMVENAYDIIISFLDSINYLTTYEDILQTFTRIYKAIKNEGYFIFDVHSLNKVHQVFDGYCYNETMDDYTYLWNSYVEREENFSSVYHELIFFIKQTNDLYKRLEEFHHQVIFPLPDYVNILEKVGFKIEKMLYDFDNSKNETNCDKIIIVAKK
ncbi:class I SAM-dependent methyltransferase [Mycoplasmatota bacterium]|nr:class I SAM-dependent methyltransferase [Mycoplasmatota bacterium]